MTTALIVWGIIIIVGVLVIMSGYSESSDEEKENKKGNLRVFFIVLALLFISGSLGLCDGGGDYHYFDDPSEWARKP
jgi:hypothetical protein